MNHALIFDLGTTYFKAVLFDAEGRALAVARRDTPIVHPRPERAEITAAAFKSTVAQLVEELRGSAAEAFAAVRDISFATQTNSFLLLDERDEPMTPIIVWTDRRSVDIELPALNDYRETGIPGLGPYFTGAKLLWIRRHQPEVWRRARRFCLLSDYLTLWLTGRHVTEAGASGLTAMLDIHRLTWRGEALRLLHLDHITMPEVVRAGTPLGAVLPEVAAALGLPAGAGGCRFTVGCLDQYASAVAADLLDEEGLCETTGTVLATVRAAADFDPALQDRGVFQGPSPRADRYYRMLFGSVSANLLAAYRKSLTPPLPSYESLDAEAAALGVGDRAVALEAFDVEAGTLRFTAPAHGGKRTRGQEVQAIYVRVAEALRDQVAGVCGDAELKRLVSLGGGARSEHWRAIKASLLGVTPRTLPTEEPTSYGAFRLIGR